MTTRFDLSGNEYRIVEPGEGQIFVWIQVRDEHGESYDGELRIVQESALHATAPRAKVDDQIAELQATRIDLNLQIRVLRQELKTFEDGADDRVARIKRHKSLGRLDDYLAGRITHYVESGYGPPKIVAFEDAKTGESERRNELKLLTLFGRTDGDLEWKLSQYSDGSGIKCTVIPCLSHGEAVNVVKELFASHEARVADNSDRAAPGREWCKRAAEYGFAMVPKYVRDLEAREAATKRKNIEDLESKLQKLRGV